MKLCLGLVLLVGCAQPTVLKNPMVPPPSVDAQLVYIPISGDYIHVLDLHDHTQFDVGPPGALVFDISDDGEWLVAEDETQLFVYDANKQVARLAMSHKYSKIALSPDHATVAAYSSTKNELTFFNIATQETVSLAPRELSYAGIAWTLNSKSVVLIEGDPFDSLKGHHDVYSMDTKAMTEADFEDKDLYVSTGTKNEPYGHVCTTADGTTVDFSKIAKTNNQDDPLILKVFLPGCAAALYDFKNDLVMIDPAGNASIALPSTGIASGLLTEKVVAVPGHPLAKQ